MSRPKVLEELDQCVRTTGESEELGNTLPVDADTLSGHPVSYFASKAEVNLAIYNYVSTVLGKSY